MSQHLKKLLYCSQELSPLLAKVEALSVLQRHFTSVIPPHLAQSSQVLGMHQGTLNVAVANAAIAAKLRQLAPELTALLENRGCEVNGIRFTVQVSYDSPRPNPAPREISQIAQKTLHEFSQCLDESPLKQALNKLAGKKN